jgi:site-specific DNA-methyltransferase (adenine-specific)
MDKKTKNLMFSKKSDDWSTPKHIYDDFINREYVDPCPLHCETNNLEKDFGNVKMFINPPYSGIKYWVEFAIRHHKLYGKEIVFLVPSRTDTKWFHTLLEYGVKLNFLKGRLNFSGLDRAPFPSVFITLEEIKHE